MNTENGRPRQAPATNTTALRVRPNAPGPLRTTPIGQSHWFACGRLDQRRAFAEAISTARELAAYRRRLVLAHPDLSEALVARLGYTRPEQWFGYIPPRFTERGDAFGYPVWEPSDSPARAVLLELVAAAEARGGP